MAENRTLEWMRIQVPNTRMLEYRKLEPISPTVISSLGIDTVQVDFFGITALAFEVDFIRGLVGASLLPGDYVFCSTYPTIATFKDFGDDKLRSFFSDFKVEPSWSSTIFRAPGLQGSRA